MKSFFNNLFSLLSTDTMIGDGYDSQLIGQCDMSDSLTSYSSSSSLCHDINPANGLPMMSGIDIMGNPYGSDFSSSFDSSGLDCAFGHHDTWSSHSFDSSGLGCDFGHHDTWSSSSFGSGFD